MKLLVLYGSVRQNRQEIKAARFVQKQMADRGHEALLIDPLEYDFGMLDLQYREYAEEEKPPKMKELAEHIESADGLIIVSGEYNSSIPPALTNMMDHFYKEYFHKPACLVTYSSGRFSGVRAAVQLRSFVSALGMILIPATFMIPKIKDVFEADGTPREEGYEKRFHKTATQLEWYMKVIKEGMRVQGHPEDHY